MWRNTILLYKDPKNLEIFDKRFNPPFIASKPDGQNIELLLQETDQISIDKANLNYFTPNIVALQFSIAKKAMDEAKGILDKLITSCNVNDKHIEIFDRLELIKDSKLVCDYLEKIQVAIVFSFTAVETFANLSIPNKYVYFVKSKKCKEEYNKHQIERWVYWKIKISDILTEIYKTTPIVDELFWPKFCELVKTRDSIIHQKSLNDTAYLESFFTEKVFDICLAARKVVMFYKESVLNKHALTTMNGNEYLWPILDEEIITIGVNSSMDVKLAETT